MMALEQDPAFDGSVIDLLNLAEKQRWIASAETWKAIRKYRNVTVHVYENEDLRSLYGEILKMTPSVLQLKALLKT